MEQIVLTRAEYDALKAQLAQLATLQAMVAQLTAEIAKKDEIIRNMNRTRFGQSSEKRSCLFSADQISMFEQAGDGISEKKQEKEPEQKEVHVPAHTCKAKRKMDELIANLPEVPVVYDLSEEEKRTADGRERKCVGEDLVRVELVREPARIYVVKYYCKAYADPEAEKETGHADIRRPQVPAPLLPHSYASASIVSDIIIKKFGDALPLYRQEQMWHRLGVDLKRNTMSNWVIQTAQTYLEIFREQFLQELLAQKVIHADETVLQVNKEPGKAAAAESRIWAYASSKRAERQIRIFRYEESRKGECVEKILGNYCGAVVSDGYCGYNVLTKATRAGCWAHARRKWVEALPNDPNRENTLAAKGLEYCSRIFEIERKLEGLSDEARREQRRLLSRPIVEEYYAWLETIFKPAGKLKNAVVYSMKQKPYLCAFLDHGEIEISNNQVENAIRPVVVGRKNWLFCDTQDGAKASATIFTLLETAKANGLNPETYLNHLLSVLPQRFADDPNASVDDLMPWAEGMVEMFGIVNQGTEH